MVKSIRFVFVPGIAQPVFSNVRLVGSWDSDGLASATWSTSAMQETVGPDGCPAYAAVLSLDSAQTGQPFRWGVILDGPAGPNVWGIPIEINDANSTDRYRTFPAGGRPRNAAGRVSS